MNDVSGARTPLSSMTGFAARRDDFAGWTWTVELRSVNGRGLDLRFRVPDWIEGLEPALRKLCQGRVARGSVTLSIRLQRSEAEGAARLSPSGLGRAIEMLREIETQAGDAGLTLVPASAADIAAMRGVVEQSDPAGEAADAEALLAALTASAAKCLNDFAADRAREGRAIAAVLGQQIDRVAELAEAAAARAGDREAAARAGMERALARLLDATEVPDEARLLQELALIAVKNDITEEIDRLRTHVAAALALIEEPGAVGRKFDFLTQEFNREANTLCSKAQSPALTAIGLDLKAVIDQMREQVQNVE